MKNILRYLDYEVFSNAECKVSCNKIDSEKTKFNFCWQPIISYNEKIEIRLSVPCIDVICTWHPTCIMSRNLNICDLETSVAWSAPLAAMCNSKGNSIFSVALSDSVRCLKYSFCLNEKTAEMDYILTIDLSQFGREHDYSIILYTQREEKPFYEMCKNVSKWWDDIYKLEKLPSPCEANMPCYSSWYAFHHNFTYNELINEAKMAKECGMNLFILDAGWNTDNIQEGSKYSGDWNFSTKKVTDMRKLSDGMHKIGMKFMIWYSVSFLGMASENWKNYFDKTMQESEPFKVRILDPRYSKVREHIISGYEKALREWNVDGLKLDFIDLFKLNRNNEFKDGMDIFSVEAAVEKLLLDACARIRKIKSDAIIEFRQSYVGPNLRKYATIFRAVDCPANYRQNRVSIVDLRMTSGNTIVNSDMIMWNKNDTVEGAALQILNVIFSVIQFSVRINTLSSMQKKMLKFWLTFSKKYRKILTECTLKPKEMQNFYPIVSAEDDETCITAIYQIDKIIDINLLKDNLIINASGEDYTYLRIINSKKIFYTSYDCMGYKVESNSCYASGILKVSIPKSGLLTISLCDNKFQDKDRFLD